MKRALATGLFAVAATAASAIPAHADGLSLVDSPDTGSASVIHCDDGPRVQYLGTGSAVIDAGASVLGVLYMGYVGAGSAQHADQNPCYTTRFGLDALLTNIYRSGSAG